MPAYDGIRGYRTSAGRTSVRMNSGPDCFELENINFELSGRQLLAAHFLCILTSFVRELLGVSR